jgi:hypothetical protein|tara:strand:- start:221 stop:1303 length:1083 start_codon:yes stop_codon:yes gene_type:complete
MCKWLLILLVGSLNAAEIGEISELKGTGEITRKDSNEALLAELASDIFSFDDVRTGNGRMAIQFLDSSVLKLTEHSKVVIDNYIYDPDPSKTKLALNMASGTARFITGKLGRINNNNIRIRTPSATIAIRGTDFTTTVDELGRSLIILLPNPDGTSSGEIAVETWSGTEILNKPFQATMVSTFESRPTKAVVLGNITLGLIDNMLIINKPPAIVQAVEEQSGEVKTELDKDFFEDAPDLDKDFLETEEEISRLDIDLLSFDFLVDLLAIVEAGSKKKTASGGELEGVELTGIIPGFDPTYQTYTFVDGAYLYLVHQGTNTFDIALDKYAAAYLNIDTAGIVMEIEVNGAGDNTIVIVQSP